MTDSLAMRRGQDEFTADQHAPALVLDLPVVLAHKLHFPEEHLPRPDSKVSRVIQGLHTAICDTVVNLVMMEYISFFETDIKLFIEAQE